MTARLVRTNPRYSDRPLSDEEIRAVAPSVFATSAHQSRSPDRYRFIPTPRILKALREHGFLPYMVHQSFPRDQGKHGYAKHVLRFRKQDEMRNKEGEFPEAVYIGAHDGTCAVQMYGGYFRLVCTNGLICGHDIGEIRIPHMGERVISMVINGANKIVGQLRQMDEHKQRMKEIELTEVEKGVFAEDALNIRYGDRHWPIEPRQVLIPRHPIDVGNNSIWAVFNTAQQNLTQGGISGHSENNRKTSTRPINGIDQMVNVNRRLWDLAEHYLRRAA